MEKTPKEMLKGYVNSQKFNSATEIMDAMKEMFRDVLQQVMESELDTELGYEKSQRMSDSGVENKPRNYRNGYSKKTVKTQLGAVDVKVPRDRNGEYEPQIIGKYSRNADGMEEKILAECAERSQKQGSFGRLSVLCGRFEGLRGSHWGSLSPQPGAAVRRPSDPLLHPLCQL